MADNETIADIIAEMRGIRVREFQEYADRLEAAHSRERGDCAKCCQLGRLAGYGASEIKHQQEPVGNAAKLREALETLRELLGDLLRLGDAEYHNDFSNFCDIIDAALSAPPRNCDKYPTFNDAIRALADKRGWHDAKWDSERYCILVSWLFAPATEKEGGGR